MSRITINGVSLDPLRRRSERGVLSSADASRSSYILVQVRGPLGPEQREQLESVGVALLEYVPDDTYIARFEDSDLSQVVSLDFVSWANSYLRGFKVSPALMDGQPRGVDLMELAEDGAVLGEGQREVDIVFHEGVDPHASLVEKVAAVAGLDSSSLSVSRRKIRATIDLMRLSGVAGIDEVRHIERVPEATLSNDVALGIMRDTPGDNGTAGLRGEGQIVAVCDTGFDRGSTQDVHPAFTGRVIRLYALGRGTSDDPHGHGTHVAGSILADGPVVVDGEIQGPAPAASLVLQSVLDGGGGLGGLPTDLNDLFRAPFDEDDARIHNNSWGSRNTFGGYTSGSREVDEFVHQNRTMVICFAAGNPGRDADQDGVIDLGSVQAPGTAKNCITVGASESARVDQSKIWGTGSWSFRYPVDPIRNDLWADDANGMAAFSGRGPTQDGRIKPDIVAPGTSILSAHSRSANVGDFWGTSANDLYCYMGGTSMATPLVAGCCAIVRQFLQTQRSIANPSAALVKAVLINGAVDLRGQYVPSEAGAVPNFAEGFGRVDLSRALSASDGGTLDFHDEDVELQTGQREDLDVEVREDNRLLKATLVWTDPAGSALVNDLDLTVIASDGTSRHGNMAPESDGFDRTNNVEQVVWDDIPVGGVTVRVSAHRTALQAQSFALIVRVE